MVQVTGPAASKPQDDIQWDTPYVLKDGSVARVTRDTQKQAGGAGNRMVASIYVERNKHVSLYGSYGELTPANIQFAFDQLRALIKGLPAATKRGGKP